VIVEEGEVYLQEGHIETLKAEPEYVKKRYRAVARTLAPAPFGVLRRAAAEMIGRSLRQLHRIVGRFRAEGIPGLRHRSRRPKTFPRKTPAELEGKILKTREATGFGPRHISSIINESNRRMASPERTCPTTAYNVLVRNGVIERERRELKEWKRFEWGHPNRLIQADLTDFNTVPVLTMEDDHSRRGWGLVLDDALADTVVEGMIRLIQIKYDNLLTDNGPQFSRQCEAIRRYCERFVRENHIWSSANHPQTLGKLSALQKGLKLFLFHMLGRSRDRAAIQHWIDVYMSWYNNGRFHQGIKGYPEVRYSGQQEEGWFVRLIKAFNLEEVLVVTATE
jgi:hypothetical protein